MRTPARQDSRKQRTLLERLLDTPQLARSVPQLPAEVLHRVIERCGLEDAGEIITLATPAQLCGVFDLDLWRSGEPGAEERFDADRFAVWLEVLMQAGGEVAAQTIAALDPNLIIT